VLSSGRRLPLIMVYAFNKSNVQSWPIPGLTTHWFPRGLGAPEVRARSGFRSAQARRDRHRPFARLRCGLRDRPIQVLRQRIGVVSTRPPIALPGIITGMALNSFFTFNHINLSLWTIVVGHATFCVVIVYNNVLARLRRSSPSLLEASADSAQMDGRPSGSSSGPCSRRRSWRADCSPSRCHSTRWS